MNVLITGGAGFVGSHVADAFIGSGHHVSIIDNFTTGIRANLNPQARVFELDIRDRDAVDGVFRQGAFDLLCHFAAQLDVRLSVRDPQFDAGQNIVGTLNLMQASLATGVRRVIFSSSGGAIYGEQETFPADESHPTNPISPYGVTKLAVEKYLHYYRHEHGIEHVILRFTNLFGPRQNPHGEAGVIAIFCDQMFGGIQPVINGTGEQTRDYVYISDVVAANLAALEYLQTRGSGTFNIATNRETSVVELFRELNAMLGGKYAEQHGPPKKGEQMRSLCGYAKAEHELGWQPQVGLRQGLERTLEFYRRK